MLLMNIKRSSVVYFVLILIKICLSLYKIGHQHAAQYGNEQATVPGFLAVHSLLNLNFLAVLDYSTDTGSSY